MPASAEEEWAYWDAKAIELRRNQLTTVQTSATKWSALLTAVLGVFGTVAFAGGLATIDKLGDPYSLIAKALTSLAALSAVIGIYEFTRAAGSLSVTKVGGISANSVRDAYTTGAAASVNALGWGKKLAMLTAILVLGGSALVLWVGEKQEQKDPSSVAVVVEGQLACGQLEKGADGSLSVAGAPSGEVSSIVLVSKCP